MRAWKAFQNGTRPSQRDQDDSTKQFENEKFVRAEQSVNVSHSVYYYILEARLRARGSSLGALPRSRQEVRSAFAKPSPKIGLSCRSGSTYVRYIVQVALNCDILSDGPQKHPEIVGKRSIFNAS